MKALKWFLSKFQKRSVSERILYALIFLLFAAFALSYLYVLVWCFLSGLKTHGEVIETPFSLPTVWHFEHYLEAFSEIDVNGFGFLEMFVNSIYFSVLGGLLTTFSSMTLAYVTAKYKFKGSGIFFTASLIMILLPIYGSGGSMYLLLDRLGFLNSPMMIFSSLGGFGMNYMYFHAFFENLSWSYAEAAEIDGAEEYGIFFRIMMPMAMPMFGAIFLMVWLREWNSYESALLYLPQMPTLAVGVYLFKEYMTSNVRMDLLWAGSFLMCLPPLILFICFNKVLMSNISLGGIKE